MSLNSSRRRTRPRRGWLRRSSVGCHQQPPSSLLAIRAADFVRLGPEFEDTKIQVTVSIGIASLLTEEGDASDLVKRTDDKLYEAKAAGRNCSKA